MKAALDLRKLAAFFIFVVVASTSAEADEKQQNASASAALPAGILPVPDYSGDLWERQYLTGDWGGVRSKLADKGVQIGLQWDQYEQGVVGGGRDRTSEYGGKGDYTVNLDLMRMGVLPGALVRFRAESRYGESVNTQSGSILPVNGEAFFPLSKKFDQEIGITVSDLNYIQFLSTHLGVLVGKLDTLDGDPNEFASGRGSSQFLNANFLFNPTVALRLPYSTLGAGVLWLPKPPGPDGSIIVTSLMMNTRDASTTSGFEGFGHGGTWYNEADFQYRLGHLPGGMNVGGLWFFDQNFAEVNSRFIFDRGQGLSHSSKSSTWAVYWSGWQYLFTMEKTNMTADVLNGVADHEGIGVFARAGFADKDTNPVEWSLSGGVGGRGMIPTRRNDTFGVGYYYSRIQQSRFSDKLGVQDSTHGFEGFYNIAVTRAFHVTLDVQVLESVEQAVKTATILGVRAGIAF